MQATVHARRHAAHARSVSEAFEKAFRRSPSGPAARQSEPRPAPAARTPRRLSAAALQAAEDSLLADLLDNHPNADRALDRLLDDMAAAPADDVREEQPQAAAPRRRQSFRLVPQFTPDRLALIEELLVAAVVEHHPRRDAALDRLLDDVEAFGVAEERERATYDMTCDNDFDGLS